jgi:hypothetical protein
MRTGKKGIKYRSYTFMITRTIPLLLPVRCRGSLQQRKPVFTLILTQALTLTIIAVVYQWMARGEGNLYARILILLDYHADDMRGGNMPTVFVPTVSAANVSLCVVGTAGCEILKVRNVDLWTSKSDILSVSYIMIILRLAEMLLRKKKWMEIRCVTLQFYSP